MPPHSLAAQCRIGTPLGAMTLAITPSGLAGAWFDDQVHHPGALAVPVETAHPLLRDAQEQLGAYFAGALQHFSLPLDPAGTPFQQAVWRALCGIPAGATSRYGDIARALHQPQAARAVGAAVGRNPLSIVVPCHRVLGRDGSLTGYAGGLARKRALLALEAASAGVAAAA
jgi:methylated-DNA-[protein]-cysteine S-methyltransferase